jgi:hypothetical protein
MQITIYYIAGGGTRPRGLEQGGRGRGGGEEGGWGRGGEGAAAGGSGECERRAHNLSLRCLQPIFFIYHFVFHFSFFF